MKFRSEGRRYRYVHIRERSWSHLNLKPFTDSDSINAGGTSEILIMAFGMQGHSRRLHASVWVYACCSDWKVEITSDCRPSWNVRVAVKLLEELTPRSGRPLFLCSINQKNRRHSLKVGLDGSSDAIGGISVR